MADLIHELTMIRWSSNSEADARIDFPTPAQLRVFGTEILVVFDLWSHVHTDLEPGVLLRQAAGRVWEGTTHAKSRRQRYSNRVVRQAFDANNWAPPELVVKTSLLGIGAYGHDRATWGGQLLGWSEAVLREGAKMIAKGKANEPQFVFHDAALRVREGAR